MIYTGLQVVATVCVPDMNIDESALLKLGVSSNMKNPNEAVLVSNQLVLFVPSSDARRIHTTRLDAIRPRVKWEKFNLLPMSLVYVQTNGGGAPAMNSKVFDSPERCLPCIQQKVISMDSSKLD